MNFAYRIMACALGAWVAIVASTFSAEVEPQTLLKQSRRVLFLGDSITAAGHYVASFDAWLTTKRWPMPPEVINAGLPSETVSGLSEEGHAGGKFPRPDLAERLDRVLDLVKPDLVVACYGINCGIYLPWEEARFQRYQQGLERLKSAVEKRGATLVLVTPPFYDDRRAPKGFPYNEVLDRYSQWVLSKRSDGWHVVDLHDRMTHEVQSRRQADTEFTFQPDGVHPNEAGHWFIVQQLLRYFGDAPAAAAESPQAMLAAAKVPAEVLPLVQQRAALLRNAYVAAAGHKRPGVAAGLPVPEARDQAQELTRRITSLVQP